MYVKYFDEVLAEMTNDHVRFWSNCTCDDIVSLINDRQYPKESFNYPIVIFVMHFDDAKIILLSVNQSVYYCTYLFSDAGVISLIANDFNTEIEYNFSNPECFINSTIIVRRE